MEPPVVVLMAEDKLETVSSVFALSSASHTESQNEGWAAPDRISVTVRRSFSGFEFIAAKT